MNRFLRSFSTGAILLSAFLFVSPVLAADPSAKPTPPKGVVGAIQSGLIEAAAAYQPGNTQTDLKVIIGRIISIALGFLGVLLLVYLIIAGFLWMTAGGDETKVKKARGMIKDAVIGILIIGLAFAISNFVLKSLNTAVAK